MPMMQQAGVSLRCSAHMSPSPVIERRFPDALWDVLRTIKQLEYPVIAVQDMDVGSFMRARATDIVFEGGLLAGEGSKGSVGSALVLSKH